MNKLDFAAINQALDPLTVVPQWLPHGHKNGKEWIAANPTRADRTAGSFSVNLNEGHWRDFATNDGGADLVSLYAYLFCGSDQGKAAHELAQNHGVKIGDPVTREQAANVHKIEEAKPVPVFPVPASASQPKFWHPKFGTASIVWPYNDKDGKTLMYVCRFDPEGERKQVLPYTFCTNPNGSTGWRWRGITRPAKVPLYGLELLAASPDADVIMVEGEKATDAGRRLFEASGAVVTSWLGGIENADRANLNALAGRRVVLWPDFDSQRERLTADEANAGMQPEDKPMLPLHEQPGMRAMMAHATALKGVAREVIMVRYTVAGEFAHGWDLADAEADGWSTERAAQYMAQNSGDPWHVATAKPAPAPETRAAKPPAPAPANDNEPKLPINATVNPFGWPHLTDKGQPLNTRENLEYMIGEYGITAAYNEVRRAVELHIPEKSYSRDNRANNSLAELNSIAVRNRMPQGMLADYVKLIADGNTYNPVKNWINSAPWDGTSRINDLCTTVQVSGERTLTDKLIRRWMISAIAAIYMESGFESHGVLVFTGSQGQGKTKWIKRLVPPELLDSILVGAVLDPSNKDTVTNAISHWLVELGELDATFRKADIARLKSFVTNATDKVRRPYDRIESEYQRRTVFFASVNEDRYLVDDTGNRRWWTVPVIGVDYNHTIDMQQVWAEVLEVWNGGEQHWLSQDEFEALNSLNAEHENVDPVEEMILSSFQWGQPDAFSHKDMTASDVLAVIGYDKPNKAQATHASKVLKKLTGADPVRRNNGRFFRLPPATKRARFEHEDEGRPF